jgi:hypothetical protein
MSKHYTWFELTHIVAFSYKEHKVPMLKDASRGTAHGCT